MSKATLYDLLRNDMSNGPRPKYGNDAAQTVHTPYLQLDVEQAGENYDAIRAAFPGVEVCYALKCNPDALLVDTLRDRGAGFEIASPGETEQLLEQGVAPDRLLCLHPIKSPAFLRMLHRQGVDILAADCAEEIEKIGQYAPGSRVVIRVDVPNNGSVWDLSGKFGAPLAELPCLFALAAEHGLIPYGVTIHVGSQCEKVETWQRALSICRTAWRMAEQAGFRLQLLSLGGGLPVFYRGPVPSVFEIGNALRDDIAFFRAQGCRITIEPGRAIAATAGTLVSTVIGVAERGDTSWVYLDAGVYHGMIEAMEVGADHLWPLAVEHNDRPLRTYHISGPTCAGTDVPFRNVTLPELRVGDRLYVRHVGAYSVNCSSPFNGFPIPSVQYRSEPTAAESGMEECA